MQLCNLVTPFSRTLTLLLLACCILNSPAQSPALLSSNQVPCKDFLASDLNTAVDPGKDFFEYANGGWIARNPIPASEAGWGIGTSSTRNYTQNFAK